MKSGGNTAGRYRRPARGFSSSAHHATARSPDFAPPFCAAGGAVSLDDGAVDHLNAVRRMLCKRQKDTCPKPTSRPPIEEVISCRVGPIPIRQITPRNAGTQHEKDCVEIASYIQRLTSSAARRKVRLDYRPLLVGQVEPHLSSSPVFELESRLIALGNDEFRYRP